MTDNLPVVKSIRMIRKNDTRELIRHLKMDAVEFDCETYSDAADRIEKLEAALREIAWIATPDHAMARSRATHIARKALEDKQ